MPVLVASLNTTLSSKTVTDFISPKIGNPCTETQHPWHHSVDKKYYILHVKFGVSFVNSFMRKYMCNKKWTLFTGDPFFFQKAAFEKIDSLLVFPLEDGQKHK
jgi:hypothetical protein